MMPTARAVGPASRSGGQARETAADPTGRGAQDPSERRAPRAALHAFAWTAVFTVWHGYWALGGDFGFGDQQSAFPDAGWLFTVPVVAMFAAGLVIPLALARRVGPRRLLVWLMWAGAAVLVARGLVGLTDDVLRFSGLVETGLSGLSDEQVLGTADPSAYTIWSVFGLDAFFVAGGLLFGRAALCNSERRPRLPDWLIRVQAGRRARPETRRRVARG